MPLATAAQVKKGDKPNIILFLVDDMGWQDTSVPFWKEETPLNRRYHTPNMERLAAEGVKFTNAYGNPVCTATRVSLMSGSSAARHGVTNWTYIQKDFNTDYRDSLVNSAGWNVNGLSAVPGVARTFTATPLPEVLRRNGYYTVLSGKAHFGPTPDSDPLNLGFDVNIGGGSISFPASFYGRENFDAPQNGKSSTNAVQGLQAYHGTDVFLSDALTTEALKAVEQPIKKGDPFFLYLAHYAVHAPIQADERYAGKYREAGLDNIEAAYASMVEGMDKTLGDIFTFLEERAISDNTIIIFMSDNGGLSRIPPRGGDKPDVQNLPLRAGKGSVYEGGIRVPLLVKWPGITAKGVASERPVIVEDLFPTILDMAGIGKVNVIQTIDGSSFVPALKGPDRTSTERALIWHYPNRWLADDSQLTSWAGAVRKGDWKLLCDYKNGRLELYNLKSDIGEKINLAQNNPDKVKELARLLTKELQKRNALMPTFKSGAAMPWPDAILTRKQSN